MLEEVERVEGRANREFRLKFPDEIVTENLGGQLWFGAECLAAGIKREYHENVTENLGGTALVRGRVSGCRYEARVS